jgi:hypothetical protein
VETAASAVQRGEAPQQSTPQRFFSPMFLTRFARLDSRGRLSLGQFFLPLH